MSVMIIAEAGVNHNGSYDLACKLVDAAKEAGADIIKFQTFKAKNLVTDDAPKADYQKETTGDASQQSMLEKLELSYEDFIRLKAYCDHVGITFLSTPFDMESVGFLDELGIPFWKIPSGEITNYPYLVALAKTGRPIVMSTGMCDMKEIRDAVDVLKENGATDIKLLHCNTEYPTPMEDVNLRAMDTMREAFGCEVGYSDHTRGIEVPIAAVAMGAAIIEKHFTLDRNMEGPDHKASLEPQELNAMVSAIRNIEQALGSGEKKPSPSELKNREVARKSIVAKKDIREGEIFTEENLTTKRPGDGLSPMRWNEIIGALAKNTYYEGDMLRGE